MTRTTAATTVSASCIWAQLPAVSVMTSSTRRVMVALRTVTVKRALLDLTVTTVAVASEYTFTCLKDDEPRRNLVRT